MEYSDTVKLLRECDAGARMAVTSIDEILEEVQDAVLKKLLQESKARHERLGDEIHRLLKEHKAEGKEPAVMAKGMSWMKTNVKMAVDPTDGTVAELITDGCDMGIKSLSRYMNQYGNADQESRRLCRELIDIEEKLCKDIRKYL